MNLGDFLDKKARHYQPPKLHRKMLLHGHCHQKALDRTNVQRFGELFYEQDLLKKMQADFSYPSTGCCGMAGAFGFEPDDHYAVSIACGERMLLPEVRNASDDTMICADGFSCREQISQCTDREALHLAQVLQLAKHGTNRSDRPESQLRSQRRREFRSAAIRTAALVGASAAVTAILWKMARTQTLTRRTKLAW
jgi:hypothetical protein